MYINMYSITLMDINMIDTIKLWLAAEEITRIN